MSGMRIAFAMTGSFCTLRAAFEQMENLVKFGYTVTPVLSFNAARCDTRFYTAEQVRAEARRVTGREALITLSQVEPLGPRRLADAYVIAPCTGASACKLARGICDTPALLGAKSCLRNSRPVLIAPATNDGLSTAAAGIGQLLALRNVYFVPFGQDDPSGKPRSLVAKFDLLPQALAAALEGEQLQPILA